jgi:CRISPR-associated protein Cas2
VESGDDWWDEMFPHTPHLKPPGNPLMLRLIAYDISAPKRLRRIANVCEDYGLRVQKSIFECWLDKERFEALWEALLKEINPKQDSLVAYTLDSTAAKARLQAGKLTVLTEKRTRVIL